MSPNSKTIVVTLGVGSILAVGACMALAASAATVAAMMMHPASTPAVHDNFLETPAPGHQNGSLYTRMMGDEDIEAIYGPCNKEALEEIKEGFLRNVACRTVRGTGRVVRGAAQVTRGTVRVIRNTPQRIQYRRQAWIQYRSASRQPCQPSSDSFPPSYPSTEPYVGPSPNSTPMSPAPAPVVVESQKTPEAPIEPMLIEDCESGMCVKP